MIVHRPATPGRYRLLGLAAAAAALLLAVAAPPAAAAPCDPPVVSEIACENSKPGNPASEWDVSGSGSASIQGFATDISVDQGQTVRFKIDSATSLYRLDIYRMGWYGGQGARRVATVRPLSVISQQPACITQASTGLEDCGNWSESASWDVPPDAVSGIYFAKLVREDGTNGSSHVVFVVRDDDGRSEMLFQTSDTTWQAYNEYGGNSLYTGSPDGRAYKVSYNRPFTTRGDGAEDWVFNAEYPMVRWLERNGYDVSYFTGVDSHRLGAELLEHETFLSVGHDEYWSGGQRTNVEAARAAGVNLAFFSGNEVFWKTRFEPSIDGSGTANRTLVTYKETHANEKIDPQPGVWTGTWRDPRFSPPADGGRPENALTGQLFMVNAGATTAIQVPAADGKMRLWRDTSIATLGAGATATLAEDTLGYEWDTDPENGHRPPGSVRMSSTTVNGAPVLQDHGSTFGSGTARHHLTLYRHSSGALVFGAGTVQWSWGLDDEHDRGNEPADSRMQQATANLLADMGSQPATLQSGLVAPTASTDSTPPSSTITSPEQGAQLDGQVTITGTATDAGGAVGAVEVSVDGGTTWRLASGRGNWTYPWTPTGSGSFNIRSRAVDDSGNREAPSAGVTGTVGPGSCPCSIWSSSTIPANETEPSDDNAVEVGVRFRPQVDGFITGLRFYKGTTNTGTHVGHLWSRTGTMLAEATFSGETPRGWQEVALSNPVEVTAGTTYVASYHAPNGNYAWNRNFFEAGGIDSGPLRALADGEDGPNGVYSYGPSRTFPDDTYRTENYWVDVVFQAGTFTDETPPAVTSTVPVGGAADVAPGANVAASFSEPLNPATVGGSTFELRGPGGNAVGAAVSYDAATRTATLDPTNPLADDTTYTATVKGGANGVKDAAGNPLASDRVWSFTTAALPPPGGSGCPCSIWDGSTIPANETEPSDDNAVEVGVKFRPDVDGEITGLRFYKGTTNTGTHVGHLWSRTGTMLAEATFSGETPRGWQEVALSNPVEVTAGTTYVASYHAPNGNYAWNRDFFQAGAVDNGPLRALADGEDGPNGVYSYGPSRTFPDDTYRTENYWVDVVFQTGASDTQPPTVADTSPVNGATGVAVSANASATFNEAMDPATIREQSMELRGPGGALVPATVSYDSGNRRAVLDPTSALAEGTTYTVTVKGGASGVKDRAGNALANDRSWTFTTVADTTAPTVTATVPDSGATGVGISTNMSATFSEAMDPGTIGAGSVELRGPGGSLVPAAVSYDAGNRRAVLDPTSALAEGTTYTVTVKGGASGVKDAAGNPLANDRTWSFTTAAGPDETAPTVSDTDPNNNAADVAPGANVAATFNEPLNPATVSASTFELRGPGGNAVGAAVSYDAATRTATLDPTNPLAGSTTYTATIRGGASGVKDTAGNPLASDRVWSFTTAALPPPGGSGCPCSIWDGSTIPANETEPSDDNAVEVGVKFRPDVDGEITGLRFYKGTTNTGTHVGHLWSRTGTMLAEATFSGETPRGWQEVALSNPVEVTAGTTYVASYHAPNGNYAWNRDFFQAGAVDNGPLRALADNEDGGNGVYAYGPSRTFPTNTFRSENYWVDVVFQTGGPDIKAPTVAATSPVADATGVAVSADVSATFSEAIDSASISTGNMELRGPGGDLVPAAVSYDPGNRRAVLDPASALAEDTTYTATVKGGANGVKDRAGNALANNRSWSFTTAPPPPPPPDDGPGGPILAIGKATNPFSRYYAEILRAEGLNAFTTKDISTVTPAVLAAHDVVILGDIPLTTAQVTMLTDWVNAGGNLIAMRPDKQLAGLLGLLDASGTLGDAYLRVDTSRAPGAGIVDQTMQFHGTSDRYVTNGASTLATLHTTAGTATPNPAVTVRDVGSAGGQAAAFTFDLARSVVYTRQGNPAWDGQERDGSSPIRSDDLFFGGSLPDWNDMSKVAIPQADEQQRLLANLIGHMNKDRKPLPRFWYFPRGEKAVVVMTGDDHGNGGTPGRFNGFRTASPAGCSVAQWECIRGSSYIYPDTPITDAQAASYVADGFEIGLHPNTGCSNYTFGSLQTDYADQLAEFADQFPSVPAPDTSRTHCIAWSDWASQAKVELQHGIRLDTNYYYWPPEWVNDVPGLFTGSGMPMRFADLDGTMIDVYQATTQMTDESDQTYPFTVNTLLDRALGTTGYYGAFTANMHTDNATSTGANAIVSSAQSRGVPVVSGKQMLDWLDGRNGSSFGSISYADNTLSFRVTAGAGATGLRAMLPMEFDGRRLTALTRDGAAVSFTSEVTKGVEYAVFPASSGTYQASYAPDTTAPAISDVAATADVDGMATVSWKTDEPADAHVDYGTAPGSLAQSASRASLATSHSLQLTGLTPGATYHYRVRSRDDAGNASTSPTAPAAPASFTVPQAVSATPNATVIETGTAAAGNAAALSADDNVFFQVNSTTNGTRTTAWYGSFTGVTNALTNLRVSYRGRNSASCTQTVHIWRWTTSAWVQLNSRSVGTTEIALADLVPAGAAAEYVSGTSGDGEVRVRVRCTRTSNFVASGELMRIDYRR